MARGLRGFGYGFISIIVVVYLRAIGFDSLTTGILISMGSVGSVCVNVLVGIVGDRVGRRRTLLLLSTILFSASLVVVTTTNLLILAVVFLVGNTATTGSGNGPTEAIEQASMPDTADVADRNYLFSFYNITGSLLTAFGALFVGQQKGLQALLNLQSVDSLRLYFVIYAGIGLALLTLYSRLSPRVELIRSTSSESEPKFGTKGHLTKYSIIARLSGLFALDTFGAVFTNQPIVTLWLTARFSTGLQDLGQLFFLTTILGTLSYLLSARIADRIGRIRTMIVTQVPGNFLLLLMAISPTYVLAISFYIMRSLIYQMDVPARQAYIVSVVEPKLRTSASAITNVSRSAGASLAPSIAAYLIQQAEYSAPLFLAGSVKLLYNFLLYLGFRHSEERT